MNAKHLVLVFLLTGSALLVQSQAIAQETGKAGTPEYSEIMVHFIGELEKSEVVLAGDTYTPADLEEYLYNAMAMVYYARLDASREALQDVPQTNDDLTKLVEMGFMPFWPNDPMNNWEPMKVVSLGDGFYPNAFCLAVCPQAYASPVSSNETGQISFELFVYGPDESFCKMASVIQIEKNKAWSEIPNGAVYGLGYHMSSMDEIAEMKRISKEYKAQLAALEAE